MAGENDAKKGLRDPDVQSYEMLRPNPSVLISYCSYDDDCALTCGQKHGGRTPGIRGAERMKAFRQARIKSSLKILDASMHVIQ